MMGAADQIAGDVASPGLIGYYAQMMQVHQGGWAWRIENRVRYSRSAFKSWPA